MSGDGFFSVFSCFGESKASGQGDRWDTVERTFFCDCGREGTAERARGDHPKSVRGMPQLAQRTERVAGVGIVFHEEVKRDSGLIVEDIVKDGPAHKAGNVEPGMRLISIDGRSVEKMRSEAIAPLILGAPLTPVELGFEKASGEQSSVVVVREVV